MNIIYGFGEDSIGKENFLFTSRCNFSFDYLVITDSRGRMTSQSVIEKSFLYLLKEYFENISKTYIIISRPKNLTVFPTLFNFLKLNPKFKFKKLITNLGFVDCTPKKENNIEDIMSQINQFSSINNKIKDHEKYYLNNGSSEILKSIEYSNEYIIELNRLFNQKFEKCYFINTPIVSKDIKIERKRPQTFFTQLYKTNELIKCIVDINQKKNILIDIEDFNYTYDGVHYTNKGHQLIFDKIKGSLRL